MRYSPRALLRGYVYNNYRTRGTYDTSGAGVAEKSLLTDRVRRYFARIKAADANHSR